MRTIIAITFSILGSFICFAQEENSQTNPMRKIDLSGIDLGKIIAPMFYFPSIDSLTIENAKRGDAESQYKYGIYLREKDVNDGLKLALAEEGDDAMEWFEKASIQGHKEASIEAGILYYQRWRSTIISNRLYRRKAINYLKKGGAEETPQLMLLLARLAFIGYGDDRGSGREALSWCNKAISLGLPLKEEEKPRHRLWYGTCTLSDAYSIIASVHQFATGDTPQDMEKYFINTELAVKYSEQDPIIRHSSLFDLGECYYIGLGVEQNQAKAKEIWDALIIEDPYSENRVNELIEKYSGQKPENMKYIPKSKEDELREFLKM